MKMDTLYLTLQFNNKHPIFQIIHENAHNNDIKSLLSLTDSYRPYHLIKYLVTVTETHEVSRNIQLKMVGLFLQYCKKIIYTKFSFDTYIAPLFCDLKSND